MLGSPGTCRQCFCTRRLPSQLLLPAVTTGPLVLFPGGEAFLGTSMSRPAHGPQAALLQGKLGLLSPSQLRGSRDSRQVSYIQRREGKSF